MAPSRAQGSLAPGTASATATSDEAAVSQQSDSALRNARRNLNYLIHPSASASSDRPGRLRTRALLRALRYLGQFVIWRLVRWAKYAAVGMAVAAVGATAFGTVASGAGFVLAPTGIAGSIVAASIWGVGRFVARRAHRRWKAAGGDLGDVARERAHDGMPEGRMLQEGYEAGGRTVPW